MIDGASTRLSRGAVLRCVFPFPRGSPLPPFCCFLVLPCKKLLSKNSFCNGRRVRSLRARPQKRATMKKVGLFTTEGSIKIKHLRRGAHSNGKMHALGRYICQQNSCSDNCKTKLQKLNLSQLLDGSWLGGSLGAC